MRLILLHALGASGAAWGAVIAHLGRRYACVAPDLPGFGGHAAADTGIDATLRWLSRDMVAGDPAPYLLVGHSMGGKFATLLAASAEAGDPALAGMRGVVLLAASPPAPEPMEETRRTEMIAWFANGPATEADARKFVRDNVAAPLPGDLMDRAVRDVRLSSPAAWIGWLERGTRDDRTEDVGRLRTPALIVAGAEDGDLGEASQRRLNLPHYPDGRIEVVAGAAHLLPYERPARVAELIGGFADQLG